MPRKEKVNINSSKRHDCDEVDSSSEDDTACDATESNGDSKIVEHMNSIFILFQSGVKEKSQMRRLQIISLESLTLEYAEVEKPISKQTHAASIFIYRLERISSSIILNADQSMGESLLKNLKLATLDRVQNVLQEVASVYQSIEKLDGDPYILKSIVDTFDGIVAAYMRINELSMAASKKDKAINH
ncbi:hypothetical protein ACH5RR_001369 [Cinchona calisaya]|uniref:Uncharacterized protein n=1 Tax=Cinchona calisaya TaxID=153742 RepID=A0ABD3B3V7_9GENT